MVSGFVSHLMTGLVSTGIITLNWFSSFISGIIKGNAIGNVQKIF
jgi:hypothetical protein